MYIHFCSKACREFLDGGHLELLVEEDITINLRNLYSVDDKDFSDRQVCIFLKRKKKSSKGRQQDDMSGMQRNIFFSRYIEQAEVFHILTYIYF